MATNDTIADRCEFGHMRERYVWADWAICRTCLSMALLHGVEFERERSRAPREGGDSAGGVQEDMCSWAEDEEGNWDTSCGQKHFFECDGPTENSHRYCPYCGLGLLSAVYARDLREGGEQEDDA